MPKVVTARSWMVLKYSLVSYEAFARKSEELERDLPPGNRLTGYLQVDRL